MHNNTKKNKTVFNLHIYEAIAYYNIEATDADTKMYPLKHIIRDWVKGWHFNLYVYFFYLYTCDLENYMSDVSICNPSRLIYNL